MVTKIAVKTQPTEKEIAYRKFLMEAARIDPRFETAELVRTSLRCAGFDKFDPDQIIEYLVALQKDAEIEKERAFRQSFQEFVFRAAEKDKYLGDPHVIAWLLDYTEDEYDPKDEDRLLDVLEGTLRQFRSAGLVWEWTCPLCEEEGLAVRTFRNPKLDGIFGKHNPKGWICPKNEEHFREWVRRPLRLGFQKLARSYDLMCNPEEAPIPVEKSPLFAEVLSGKASR